MLTSCLSSRIWGSQRNSKRCYRATPIALLLLFTLPLCLFTQAATAAPEESAESAADAPESASAPVTVLEEVIVEEDRLGKGTHYTLGGTLLRQITGGAGDPLRGIARLPSIGTVNDFFGVLSVRGGASADNLYYFDRLPLGYPYHLLGIVSVMSAESIGKIDVHPGGFGAEFGADSQAVIDIHSRPQETAAVARFGGLLKPSFIYTELLLNGAFGSSGASDSSAAEKPLPDNAKRAASTDQAYLENVASSGQGYWYAFGRRSSLEPFFELAAQLIDIEDLVVQVPRFWSYQLKGVYKLNGTHGIVMNAVTAYDASKLQLGADEVHNSDLRGPLTSENPFDVQGVHLYSRFSPRFRSILSLTRAFTENELAFGEGYYYRTAESVYALRHDFTFDTGAAESEERVEFGYLLSRTPATVASDGTRRPEEGDPDYTYRVRKNTERVIARENDTLHRLEGYLQAREHLFTENVLGVLGVRASYFNRTGTLSLQPRARIGIRLPWNAARLSFSYGRYSQTPRLDQFVIGVRPNADLQESLATHYVLELRQRLWQRLPYEMQLNLAAYYKRLQDLVIYSKDDKQYRNGQSGFVRGAEVSLEHKISDTFGVWLAYAYTLSKRRDPWDEFHRFYTYNSPHVLTLATNYSASEQFLLAVPLIQTLDISAKWQYQSGVLYAPLIGRTPFTSARAGGSEWQPVYGDWKRTPPYHRLDLSLRFQLFGDLAAQGWELGLALEIWNLYNRRNILEVRYNENFTREEPIAQLPIVPFVALTLEF